VWFLFKLYYILAYLALLMVLCGRISSPVSVWGSLRCVRVWIQFTLICGRPSCLLFVVWVFVELSVWVLSGSSLWFCAAVWYLLPVVLWIVGWVCLCRRTSFPNYVCWFPVCGASLTLMQLITGEYRTRARKHNNQPQNEPAQAEVTYKDRQYETMANWSEKHLCI
jgi:hypothetical protein